jgi:hypothetical protein
MYPFYINLFQNIIIFTILFLQMGKISIIDMMTMPLHVRSHIFMTLGSGEDKAREFNPSDHILIVDLCKLFFPINYDNKKQMSIILAHT